MDNSADFSPSGSRPGDSSPIEWATPRPAGLALIVAGLLLILVGVVFSPDVVGVAMTAFGGVLLIVFGSLALVVRPRLKVEDSAGAATDDPVLTVRTLTGTASYPAERVHRIRVLSLRRIGRRSSQLELDLLPDDVPLESPGPGPRDDTRYLVYNRWDLGDDPSNVADDLRKAGFPVDE